MTDLQFIEKILQEKQEMILDANKKIWEYAELAYLEYKSSDLLCDILQNEGFVIKKGVADIPTSFTGTFSNRTGKPVMGILGEFDALDALAQQAGSANKTYYNNAGTGHGCGHNALGTGSLAAALILKQYLIENNKSGTVIYYGCSGEEGAGSKQFMARAGLFDGVDFVYTWHPSTINRVDINGSNAIMGANFEFKGLASHAGGSPHLGRSALDATELMSIGVNYLREHTINEARIHYAYVDAGGVSPNVVQEHTLVKYEVRSPKINQVKELFERVVNVARGAALMTDTTMSYEITMAFSDYIANDVLAKIADECMREVGAPKWEDEDYLLAKSFLNTYNEETQSEIKQFIKKIYKTDVNTILEKPLDNIIQPYEPDRTTISGGSTDVGDVTYVVPTVSINVATACIGNVGHTWQMTGQAGSKIAEKGLLTAAKMLALCAIRTMDNDNAIKSAKELVKIQNGGKYECPLSDDIKPPIGKY